MERKMKVDRMTLARARLALRQAGRDFLFDPNVQLIDFGHPAHQGRLDESDLAIRIHVRKKLSGFALEAAAEAGNTRPIPKAISGFKTDVPEGTYQLHWWGDWQRRQTDSQTSRVEVMRGGVSISDEYQYTYGTLGGLVIDRMTEKEMILSNWHVLVGWWGARPGQRIYQPGRGHGGSGADTVALLTRDAMSLNLDAAVATLNGSRGLLNDQLDLGPVRGVGQAQLGMEVVKSGRRTGVTFGRVAAIEGTARMRYDGVDRIMRNIVTIESRHLYEEVSGGGDSGSWWLEARTRQVIGLHFAGSDSPERALAHDMASVLEALNVEVAI
jgi:endonuclease G